MNNISQDFLDILSKNLSSDTMINKIIDYSQNALTSYEKDKIKLNSLKNYFKEKKDIYNNSVIDTETFYHITKDELKKFFYDEKKSLESGYEVYYIEDMVESIIYDNDYEFIEKNNFLFLSIKYFLSLSLFNHNNKNYLSLFFDEIKDIFENYIKYFVIDNTVIKSSVGGGNDDEYIIFSGIFNYFLLESNLKLLGGDEISFSDEFDNVSIGFGNDGFYNTHIVKEKIDNNKVLKESLYEMLLNENKMILKKNIFESEESFKNLLTDFFKKSLNDFSDNLRLSGLFGPVYTKKINDEILNGKHIHLFHEFLLYKLIEDERDMEWIKSQFKNVKKIRITKEDNQLSPLKGEIEFK